MKIKMVVKNEIGEFHSEDMDISQDQYQEIIEMSKSFYTEDKGFEMWTNDGFIVIPPEVTKKSILMIGVIDYDI
jgi:hypothetical protein